MGDDVGFCLRTDDEPSKRRTSRHGSLCAGLGMEMDIFRPGVLLRSAPTETLGEGSGDTWTFREALFGRRGRLVWERKSRGRTQGSDFVGVRVLQESGLSLCVMERDSVGQAEEQRVQNS